jgi:hypothetical protein
MANAEQVYQLFKLSQQGRKILSHRRGAENTEGDGGVWEVWKASYISDLRLT